MTNLQKLTALIVEAVPSIMELKLGCRLLLPVKNTGYYQSVQKGDIVTFVGDIFEPKHKHLGVNKCKEVIDIGPVIFSDYKVLGRQITLEDCMFCILNKPNKDWEWRDKAIKILLDNWELMECLSDQSEETINKLLEILQ